MKKMEKSEIRTKISKFITQSHPLNILELKDFHRQLEKKNAHAIIEDKDDQVLKDIEFLLRSSIILRDIGKPDDWKLQLEAAVSILDHEQKETHS